MYITYQKTTAQVKSCVDYGHGNWMLAFLSGALNYQVTHHLFPGVSQVRFAARQSTESSYVKCSIMRRLASHQELSSGFTSVPELSVLLQSGSRMRHFSFRYEAESVGLFGRTVMFFLFASQFCL